MREEDHRPRLGRMGYGVSLTYGLWSAIARKPTWWMDFAMGYKDMGYEDFDCMCTSQHICLVDFRPTTSLLVSVKVKVSIERIQKLILHPVNEFNKCSMQCAQAKSEVSSGSTPRQ